MTRRKPPVDKESPVFKQDEVYSIDDLARQVVSDAMGADVGLELRIDALKAVTTYELGMNKVNAKKTEEPGNVEQFSSIKKRIKEAGNNG